MVLQPLPVPPLWLPEIETWQDDSTTAGLSPATIATRVDHLRRAARQLGVPDPYQVTTSILVTWLGSKQLSLETRRSIRTSLTRFYSWAIRAKRTSTNPADDLPKVKAAQPKPRPTPDPVVRTGIEHAQPRVRLMIMLAAELGLRRAEIAVIHHNDLQQTGSGWHLIVHGKGRKQRTNPLPEHLAYWLNERTNLTGYAFPGNDHGHLSPSRVGKLISAALPAGWTAHTLRHRYATAVWQKSHDLLTIQRLLGHTSPATTQRYIAADDEHLRSVSNLAKL